jgi:hypothetical protein
MRQRSCMWKCCRKWCHSDQKSRGFHIHKSHLSDPTRISRLLVAACLAYIWMICLGVFVISQGKSGLIDRTDRVDKSLFRLGIDWLKHVLKRGTAPRTCRRPSASHTIVASPDLLLSW